MADIPKILITSAINIQASKNQINADIKTIQAQANALNLDVKVDTSSAKKALKEFQNQPILKMQTDQLNSRIQTWMQGNSRAAKEYNTELQQIITSTKNVNSKLDLSKATQQFRTVQRQAESLGLTGRTLTEEFKNDLAKITQWFSATTVLVGGISTIRQMITTVSDLNSAATDLQMVTGGNTQQTTELLTQYNKLGQELGATTTEVANSGSEWLRQGKSISDTNTLIKDSMILSKVAKIDSADATQYLTSAMKGYNVSAKDTLGIVDKLNAVDLVSATSAGGLAQAMSRTANAANLAGVSMNKLLGYEAIIGETTQKPMEEVGTSLQAIFSRMGNVKAKKFVDDETGEALNDVEAVLGKIGIKLRDSQDSFRNFGDVLDEVGGKWKSYNDVEKNAAATAIAGKQSLVLEYTAMYSVAV